MTLDSTSLPKATNASKCKQRRDEHVAAGICTRCLEPAIEGLRMCQKHREREWDVTAERKEKIKAYKKSIRAIENARKRTPKYRAYINALKRKRKAEDPAWAVVDRLRKRVGRAIRDYATGRKDCRTADLIGCSVPQLMAHIESLFLPGMSWDNRNLWHIDHIRPCASFYLADPEQQRICFHYTNLQPLWAQDNIRKHAKILTAAA